MKKQKILVLVAVSLLVVKAYGKQKNQGEADRGIASTADQISECSDTLKTVIASTETAHTEDFGSIIKDVNITNVRILGSRPCGGGAEHCTMTSASGTVSDAVMTGHFTVSAGRGSCFIQAISVHPTSK